MNDHLSDRAPTERDVAGAWLFCVLMAGLALALSADLHRDVPSAGAIAAGAIAASTSPPPTMRTGAGAVTGLHRLALPVPRPDLARPG
jgi:hypothetical protein